MPTYRVITQLFSGKDRLLFNDCFIEAITSLMDELAGTENRISVERRRYNETVLDYNTAIKTFPRNMLAGMFGFSAHEYFKSVSSADEVPKVEF